MKHIEQLREIAPYIRAHQGTTVVMLLSGEVQQQSHYSAIIKDILLLHSIGARLLLVFGCRPQIHAVLQQQGLNTELVDGVRITTEEQLQAIVPVVAEVQLRHAALFGATARVAPLQTHTTSLVWGNWIAARPLGVIDGVDFASTGQVGKIDRASIHQLLDADQIVAFHCLHPSRLGDIYNLGSEHIAGTLARQFSADKLIIYTDQQAIQNTATGSIVDYHELQQHLPQVADSQRSLLQMAIDTCQERIRVHLIDAQEDGSLLKELFTREGSGLMVTDGNHERINQASAQDIPEIHELIAPMERDGLLRPRDLGLLEQQIKHFFVMRSDGVIIGCAALHPLDEDSVELACFVIAPECQGQGKGYTLLQHIETQAKQLGFRQLLVLTTRTKDWFEGYGFFSQEHQHFASVLQRSEFDPCRNARLLVKHISHEDMC